MKTKVNVFNSLLSQLNKFTSQNIAQRFCKLLANVRPNRYQSIYNVIDNTGHFNTGMIGRKKPPVGAFCLTSTMASANTKENNTLEKYKNMNDGFSEHDDSGISVTSPTVEDQKSVPALVTGLHDHWKDLIVSAPTSTVSGNVTQSVLPHQTLMMKFQLTGPPCSGKKKKTVLPAELLQSVTEKIQRKTLLEASSCEIENKNSNSCNPVDCDSTVPLQHRLSTDSEASVTTVLSKEKDDRKTDFIVLESPGDNVASSCNEKIDTGLEFEDKYCYEAATTDVLVNVTNSIEKTDVVSQVRESSANRSVTISQPLESFVTAIQFKDVTLDNVANTQPLEVNLNASQALGTDIVSCQLAAMQQVDVLESPPVDHVLVANDHSEKSISVTLGHDQSFKRSVVHYHDEEFDCNITACPSIGITNAAISSQAEKNETTASQPVKTVSTVDDGDDICIPLGDIHVDVLDAQDDVVADDSYNISALFSEKFDQAYKKYEKRRRKEGKRKQKEKKKEAKCQCVDDSSSNKDDEKQRHKQHRKKPIPNYFVSVQITNIKIRDGVKDVQDCILNKNPDLKKTLIAIPKLHLTLFVMLIETDEDMERARSAMDLCAQRIYDRFETELVSLDIRGIGDFRNEVVFAKVRKGGQLDNLTSMADIVHDCFVESGVPSAEKKGSFKPHITIAKMSKAAFLRHKGIKKIERHLYEEHVDRHFGHQVVTDLQLCAMLKPKDHLTGYYQVERRACFSPKARHFSTLHTDHCLDEHEAADIIVQWSIQSATEHVASLPVESVSKTQAYEKDGDMCHSENLDKVGEKVTEEKKVANCTIVENLTTDDTVTSSVLLENQS